MRELMGVIVWYIFRKLQIKNQSKNRMTTSVIANITEISRICEDIFLQSIKLNLFLKKGTGSKVTYTLPRQAMPKRKSLKAFV